MSKQSNTTNDPNIEPCKTCGQPAEMIPYMDYAGCGSAVIELWRCPDGHGGAPEYAHLQDVPAADLLARYLHPEASGPSKICATSPFTDGMIAHGSPPSIA